MLFRNYFELLQDYYTILTIYVSVNTFHFITYITIYNNENRKEERSAESN